MLAFIAASDLHLKECAYNGLPNMRGDSLLGFKSVLHYANERGVPLVLAGDTFDSNKITPAFYYEVQKLRRLYPDVTIYYINGNHDYMTPSWTATLDNTIHLGAAPHDINGVSVCGMDYVAPADFARVVSVLHNDCDVLVIHQTLSCFSHGAAWEVDIENIKFFNTVIAGDYHVALQHSSRYFSPGPGYSCTKREMPGTLLEVETDGKVGKIVPLPSRPRLEIRPDSDIEFIKDQIPHCQSQQKFWDNMYIPDEVRIPLIRVEGVFTPEQKEQWCNIDLDAHLSLYEVSQEKETEVEEEARYTDRSSCLLDVVQEYPAQPEVLQAISDLIQNPDAFIAHEVKYLLGE